MNLRAIQRIPDQTIADRLAEIEKALKFDPNHEYRREMVREYCALTTDPEERFNERR